MTTPIERLLTEDEFFDKYRELYTACNAAKVRLVQDGCYCDFNLYENAKNDDIRLVFEVSGEERFVAETLEKFEIADFHRTAKDEVPADAFDDLLHDVDLD